MSPTTTRPDAAQFQALVAAQGVTRQQIALQVAAITAGSARQFTGWYDHDQITEWATRLAKVVEPLLRLLARNTDAYTARAVTGLTGDRFRAVGAVDVTSLRQGVTHAGAYARAADVYRWQQSQYDQIGRLISSDPPKADDMAGLVSPLDAAVERVRAVADTDTQLVVRAQAQQTMRAAQDRGLITGWRRVVHPELSVSGSCGLCIAAADRIYTVSELQPIHGRCKCEVAPIKEHIDPGLTLNRADLDRLYKDAGSTSAKDLKRVRYRIDEHGELGPVLTDAGGPRISATASARRANTPRPPKPPEVLRADLTRTLADLQAAVPKATANAAENPKKWAGYQQWLNGRIAGLEQELRGLAA